MVWTNAQTTAFFEAAVQMAIPAATRAQLQTEGINLISDLSEFDDEQLQQVSDNLHRPPGCVPVDPADPGRAMTATPPFVFGAKSFNQLKAATEIA